MAHSLEYLTHYVIQGICISGLISYMLFVAPRKYSTLTFLSLFEILLSSEPDIIESPTMTGLFLLQFWRFVFELHDIWGFFICINLFCCFWQNSRNWFSIVCIYLFSISRCCCISSPRCLSQCVWFSVILLYVLFSTVRDIFSLCLKTIYSSWNNLGKLKICVFVRIFTVHGGNSFSTHAKFSEKLTFLIPW